METGRIHGQPVSVKSMGNTLFIVVYIPTNTVDLRCRVRGDKIDGGCLMDMEKDDLEPADFPSMKKVCAISNTVPHFNIQYSIAVLHTVSLEEVLAETQRCPGEWRHDHNARVVVNSGP